MVVQFNNVDWDTDGKSYEDCGLPCNFVASINEVVNYNIDDFLSDWLSDNYGYCHFGFSYEIIEE